MTHSEEIAVARLLRTALGYESREVRIGRMKTDPSLEVRMLVAKLENRGWLMDKSMKELLNWDPKR